MTAHRPDRGAPLVIHDADPGGVTPSDLFWRQVVPAPPGECWLWSGCRNKSGYGLFSWGGRQANRSMAHRFSYQDLRAEIPPGLVLDHLCRNRACVNPWHLEPVTIGVNVKRGKGVELRVARALARTHCKRGHELSEENVYHPMGIETRRDCRECKRLADRRNYTPEKRRAKREQAKERAAL